MASLADELEKLNRQNPKPKQPRISRNQFLKYLLAGGFSAATAWALAAKVYGVPSGNPREVGEDYISFIDRALYNTGSLLKATDLSGVEGRYISRASLEQIKDSEIASDAAIAKSKISTTGTWTRTELAAPHHRKAFAAYQSAAQSIAAGTFVKLIIDTEEFDLDSVFASSIYTPGQVGYYLVGGAVLYDTVEDGKVNQLRLYKNGAFFKLLGSQWPGAVANPIAVGSALVYLSSATDYLEFYTFHTNSVAKNTVPGSSYTYFWGFEI